MLKLSDESLVLASTTGSLAEDTLVTRLQKLDAEGTRLYGDDGIVASPPGEFVEVAPRLLAPASGGSFWLLLRTVNAAEELEYWLQRVSYDGTVQFTARVADQDASSTARDFRLVTTEGGEAQLLYTRGGTLRYDLVDGSGTVTSTTLLEGPLDAWEAAPAEGGFWVTWNEGAEVRAMRYSTAGTAQLDPPEGLVLPPPLTLPSDLLCVEDGGGGLYVLANNPLESPLLAMHVDEQGDVVNPLYEARPWAVVSDQPRPLFRIQLRKDAQGGFVVAWGADVYTLPGPGSDVMVQRVNDWFVSAPERKEAVPTRFSLSPPWPNPFNPSTTVRITVPSAGHAVVTVHDLLGREVARIHEGRLAPGEYTVRWDGSTHGGVRAASGTYFIHLESGGAAITRKAVLMK
jgi:hypothetical protein